MAQRGQTPAPAASERKLAAATLRNETERDVGGTDAGGRSGAPPLGSGGGGGAAHLCCSSCTSGSVRAGPGQTPPAGRRSGWTAPSPGGTTTPRRRASPPELKGDTDTRSRGQELRTQALPGASGVGGGEDQGCTLDRARPDPPRLWQVALRGSAVTTPPTAPPRDCSSPGGGAWTPRPSKLPSTLIFPDFIRLQVLSGQKGGRTDVPGLAPPAGAQASLLDSPLPPNTTPRTGAIPSPGL